MIVINIIREINPYCTSLVEFVTETARRYKDIGRVHKAVSGHIRDNSRVCCGISFKKNGDTDLTLTYKESGQPSQVLMIVNSMEG